jgi:hypothetical protein
MIYDSISNKNDSKESKMTAARTHLYVELPSVIKSALKCLSEFSPYVYLVGSTVHTLMNREILDSNQTIDIVFITPKPDQFNVTGFHPCLYNPYLYSAESNGFLINCYVAPASKSPFLYQDALKRDFIVACLFCDIKGNILDPLMMGLSDFKNKTLQTVNWNPLLQFEKDPTQLLRAINYMVLGYRPTPKLQSAIQAWEPTSSLNLSHLYALARKHLSRTDPLNYVQRLEESGLLQKIFRIHSRATLKGSYIALAELLGIIQPCKKKNTTTKLWKPPEPIWIFHPRPYSFSLFPRYIESEAKTHSDAKESVRPLEALDLAGDYVIGLPRYP